ncbi:hypothetical protein EDB80DRAFT_878071 [Ilyonectria destructans]|nr:hypothetical protein EDB80DRAFT_878071 [Ilyonectria destructans]
MHGSREIGTAWVQDPGSNVPDHLVSSTVRMRALYECVTLRLSPSQDEFGFIWRREQKKGSVDWAFQQDEYLTSDLAVKVINDSIPTDSWIAKFRRPQASKQGECVPIAIYISRVTEALGGVQVEDQESFNDFLEYSQEHWIQHSRNFWNYPPQSDTDRICEGLFRRLFNPEMTVATKPFALDDVDADSAILWASRNDNLSVFFHFTSGPGKMLTETPNESVVDRLSKLMADHPSTFKLPGKMMTIILQSKLIYCVYQKDLEYLTGFMDVLVS